MVNTATGLVTLSADAVIFTDPAAIPVASPLAFTVAVFLSDDCHVKVVEAEPAQDMDALAAVCAHHSIGLHVADRPGKILRIRPTTDDDNAEPWPRDMTVGDAGLKHYDCIDIYFTDPGTA